MRRVFLDTSAVVALFDRTDDDHPEAIRLMEVVKKKRMALFLSDYVFDESITAALTRVGHGTAVQAGEFILNSKVAHLVAVDAAVRDKAWEYFRRHDDKDFSFTDCTSFVLMKDMDIRHYFSFDDHFRQAGFESI